MAPFPGRPDTVVPGNLRGPFDGRVVEGDSGKPVEGAAVLAAWVFDEGIGLVGPAEAQASLVETDTDGRYRVPMLIVPGRAGARLARFTLVVYKRGYVAYRSDRRFEDLSLRHDFSQTGNAVRLDKLRADASHARHLDFLGAGGPLLGRISWELPLAADEVSGEASGTGATATHVEESSPSASHEPPPLDAKVLLSPDELKAVTGFTGLFTTEPLPDLPNTPNYDSLHFRATNRSESNDAAIRVFRLAPGDAEKQFEVMLKEMPAVKETREAGDRTLHATEGDVQAVGVLDRGKGVVLLFTCGKSLCPDRSTALGIVKRMVARFGRLGRVPVSPGGGEQ